MMTPATKRECLLQALLEAGPQGLNQLDVVCHAGFKLTHLSGHCWTCGFSSDISHIRLKFGFPIASKVEQFRRNAGGMTKFNRYWIPNRETAVAVLIKINEFRIKRRAPVISGDAKQRLLGVFAVIGKVG